MESLTLEIVGSYQGRRPVIAVDQGRCTVCCRQNQFMPTVAKSVMEDMGRTPTRLYEHRPQPGQRTVGEHHLGRLAPAFAVNWYRELGSNVCAH